MSDVPTRSGARARGLPGLVVLFGLWALLAPTRIRNPRCVDPLLDLAHPPQIGRQPLAGAAGSAAEPHAELLAQQVLDRALLEFTAAASDEAARAAAAPLLKAIWTQWPRTESAVRARLLAVTTLPPQQPGAAADRPLKPSEVDFVQAALAAPEVYFSAESHASSIAVAAHVVQSLARAGADEEAWKLCLELRWKAPRVGALAVNCGRLGDKLGPSPSAEEDPLCALLEDYQANPYDVHTLQNLVIRLRQQSWRDASERLRAELLDLDRGSATPMDARIAELEPPTYPGFHFTDSP